MANFGFNMAHSGLQMANLGSQRGPGQDLAENGPFAFKPHREFIEKNTAFILENLAFQTVQMIILALKWSFLASKWPILARSRLQMANLNFQRGPGQDFGFEAGWGRRAGGPGGALEDGALEALPWVFWGIDVPHRTVLWAPRCIWARLYAAYWGQALFLHMLCKALGALLDHSPDAPPSVLPSLGVSHCRVCSGCRPPCLGRVRPWRPGWEFRV